MGHSEQVQDDYNRRAIEYIEALGSVEQMATPDRELISEWRDSCSGPLLDAGCGPGHWTELLSQDGRDVLGVDLSEEFIGHARAAYPDVSFERGDFRRLPLQSHSLGGGLDPGRWTPCKRGCSSWEDSVGSSLLSTRTRP